MRNSNKKSLFEWPLIKEAIGQSFIKLNPKIQFRNPVMFTVEIGTAAYARSMHLDTCRRTVAGIIYVQLHHFSWCCSSPCCLPILPKHWPKQEVRHKPHRCAKTREETPAKKIELMGEIFMNEVHIVPSSTLKKGDIFLCEAGDIIPMDGEIVQGIATIDESAITR